MPYLSKPDATISFGAKVAAIHNLMLCMLPWLRACPASAYTYAILLQIFVLEGTIMARLIPMQTYSNFPIDTNYFFNFISKGMVVLVSYLLQTFF